VLPVQAFDEATGYLIAAAVRGIAKWLTRKQALEARRSLARTRPLPGGRAGASPPSRRLRKNSIEIQAVYRAPVRAKYRRRH